MREELMRIAEKAGDLRYDRSTAVLATSAVSMLMQQRSL